MIIAYSANTPNGVKLTIALEELGLSRGSDYELKALNLSAGEQKQTDFLAVNPNGRFESGAVLLYLAGVFGALLPADPAARIEAIAWTYFQTGGIGPNMGQAGYAKRQSDTASFERFNTESHRLVSVMEGALTEADYLAGNEYSIDRAPAYFDFDMNPYPNVTDWLTRIRARPAVQRGLSVFD